MIETTLKKFGLSDKETKIYLSLLKLGSSPIRQIATNSEINRTTTHEILAKLIDIGLANFVDKTKHRYYAAEPPENILHAIKIKEQKLRGIEEDVREILPELKSLYEKSESKPKAKYFEGDTGLRGVLEDVLSSVEKTQEKRYFVYSSILIRDILHRVFPNWNEERINRKISVQTISIGKGGELHGLDQRKWLPNNETAPTYTIIYAGKIAHISINSNKEPIGMVLADKNTYKTQAIIFKSLWSKL